MRTAFLVGVIALLVFALPGVVAFAADLLGYGAGLNNWAEETFGISHRLALSLPAAVILFCVPPAIVLLYFLRLKRRPMAVASTYLWKKSVEDLHVNRLMQWMRRNVLLLLQLLCILLVIYAVLGVRTQGALTGGRHYIILIDNSASMAATDVAPTRLDWAKAEAMKLIDSAHDGDPGMVIVFSGTAEIRQSYTTSKDELRAAVREVEQTQNLTRIDEALALAASRANPFRSTDNAVVAPANPEPGKERTYVSADKFEADVYLLSDGKFPPVTDFALQNLNYRYPQMPDNFGGSGRSDNVGIIAFDISREANRDGKYTATVRVANHRPDESRVKVWLNRKNGDGTLAKVYAPNPPYADGVAIPGKTEVKPDDPPAGKGELDPPHVARVTFSVEGIGDNADTQLEAKIEHPRERPGDALAADDSAVLVFGVARKAKILVVTPGNKILRFYFDTGEAKALAAFTYAEPADWPTQRVAAREGKYDLVIFDRFGPTSEDDMPAANTLFVGHPPPPFALPGKATKDLPTEVTEVSGPRVQAADKRHPLMRDLGNVEEIGIDSCFRFPKLPPRTPRLLEGKDAEGKGNLELMFALSRQAFTDVVLTFPIITSSGGETVFHTSWPLQPNFPLFLRNVLIQLGNVRFAGVDETFRPGDVVALRPGASKNVTVFKPGAGGLEQLDRGTRPEVLFGKTDTLGVYTAEWDGDGGRQTRRFAVNLIDPTESDLAPLTAVQIGNTEVKAGDARRVPFEVWKVLLVAALVVVLAEWWIYNRRVQI